jgi:hypothetical protein
MAHLGGLRLLATGIYMTAQQDPHPLPPALIHSTPFVHSYPIVTLERRGSLSDIPKESTDRCTVGPEADLKEDLPVGLRPTDIDDRGRLQNRRET